MEEFDSNHLWHPYSAIPSKNPNLLVESAHGCILKLKNGTELIDGMSSWWTAIHGYNHPVLNQAAKAQLDKMSHVMFGGLTHEPAIDLGQTLLKILPKNLDQIFFCDSGSIAIEVAMKMALQYWHNKNQPKKGKFLTFRNGYHGDTLHAMSVCDPVSGMHTMFNASLPEQIFVQAPPLGVGTPVQDSLISELENCFKNRAGEIAAFICEPVVQGAGGMRFYSPEYLKIVKALCTKYNVLLIFDEIATGFGRAGKLFAYEFANVHPDITCIGKALTGGYLSLAASITTKEVSSVVSKDSCLMHGPTFMANPLACAIADASVNLLLNSPWQKNVSKIEQHLRLKLSELKNLSHIQDVRVLGAIGVIEFKTNIDIPSLQQRLVSNGVWLRPFRNLLYTMPPYIISNQQLETLTSAMVDASTNAK